MILLMNSIEGKLLIIENKHPTSTHRVESPQHLALEFQTAQTANLFRSLTYWYT